MADRTITERWGLRHTNGNIARCSEQYAKETHKRFPLLTVMHTVNGFWEEYEWKPLG